MKSQSLSNYECAIADVKNLIQNATADTPIIVDFDETLFLLNSTEAYLDTIKPRCLGVILLGFLNATKPWNWFPGTGSKEELKDWMRVVVATMVFPWTLWFWQQNAKYLASRYGNEKLMSSLTQKAHQQIIIATRGFQFIVVPLIKQLPFPNSQIIACRFWNGGTDRTRGKVDMLIEALGSEVIANSIAITDSLDDALLLEKAAKPCLTVWPESQYIPALVDTYLPFRYLERVKRPGSNYFFTSILGEDLVVVILATSWLSNQPIIHILSMFFLTLSFNCIYEAGYYENDRVAEHFEEQPTLSKNYYDTRQRIKLSPWKVWAWAFLFMIPGIYFLELSNVESTSAVFKAGFTLPTTIWISATLWLSLLLASRLTFWGYNCLDKKTRIWIYPILQSFKCFGFLCVTTTSGIGAMLFAAHVLARSVLYVVYRYAGRWLNLPHHMIRTLTFTFLVMSLALGNRDLAILVNYQALAIVLWCSFKGRNDFWETIRNIHTIVRP
jgi:hypothetical protein